MSATDNTEAPAARIDRWIHAVLDRHTASLTTTEFLKAARALSARYVERRAELGRRSPIDSAGKRAAFAGFFAPLHLVTAIGAIKGLGIATERVRQVTDLGCGTGVAAAAWALASPSPVSLTGVDLDGWSLAEAAWNWATLGLGGRTKRTDMIRALVEPARHRSLPWRDHAIVLGWSVNELPDAARERLLAALVCRAEEGATVLILEPLARGVAPWWPTWSDQLIAIGGRMDEWKLPVALPRRFQELDRAAGFRREGLGVRTLAVAGRGSA
jgi:hypothetical protein